MSSSQLRAIVCAVWVASVCVACGPGEVRPDDDPRLVVDGADCDVAPAQAVASPSSFSCPDGTFEEASDTERACFDAEHRKHGPALVIFDDTTWRSENYHHGLRHGVSTENSNGIMTLRSEWRCGVPHGKWEQFHSESGVLLGSSEFDHGDGIYRVWENNGQIAIEGEIVDGQRHGQWTWYGLLGGVLSQGSYVNGLEEGEWTLFDSRGNLIRRGRYEGGEKTGLWTELHPSGDVKSEIEFVDGEEHGHVRIYHDNGVVAEEGDYERGRRVGVWKYWSEGGVLTEEAAFVAGDRHGPRRVYYANGELSYEEWYRAGKKEGPYKAFWPSGSKHSVGQHAEGHAVGLWFSWTEGGQPEMVCDFDLELDDRCVPWDVERWPPPEVTSGADEHMGGGGEPADGQHH